LPSGGDSQQRHRTAQLSGQKKLHASNQTPFLTTRAVARARFERIPDARKSRQTHLTINLTG